MTAAVLDTSAVLAWIRDEPGGVVVDPYLPDAVMSSLNWSETAQKIAQHGADARQTMIRLHALGVQVEPFTAEDALIAAELWPVTRAAGLSLGDRGCLAVGRRLDLTVLTADKAWETLGLDVEVKLIR